jgi:uncharacterized protein (TIGR02171 family)
MNNIFRLTATVVITMIVFCTPLSPNHVCPKDISCSGMKKIMSSGMSFQQGWNSKDAAYDEKPGMRTAFTYDFWIDTTEVTQKQYSAITGKKPVAAASPKGAGDDYPVNFVSWFDAVLYCNARSRKDSLDTVYSYSSVKVLSNGMAYELTGLLYDLTQNGYRLPTESEWEFAARGGSSALPYSSVADSAYANYYAWYDKNSSNRTHPVASRLPNSLGLYDMAGNVFEWTNDWKCPYDGKAMINSLGAFQPGNEYEKVIKGGSYNYSLMQLRPSNRSATYATVLSSANEYVGFRCAWGPILHGQYIGVHGEPPPNPTIMTSESDLRAFIGTSEAKLVCVNVTGTNRTLCCVDFSRTFPYVREYLDDRNVYMPVISPDGQYTAYCSRNEGQSGPSKISIRSLDSLNSPIEHLATDTAYIPRWWINPGTGDTCIIYTNSACDNGTSFWSTTKTWRQKMSGGRPVGVPLELISDRGYHDGISVNGRYAVTGFTRLMRRDLGIGVDTQLFVPPQNGKTIIGLTSTQACNVSMSPDTGSDVRCMFLDFGYTGNSTVTGTSYGIHQYLFVSSMSGVISNFIHCPQNENAWDNTEWTNRSQFGVGCGRNSFEQSHAVYAINLDNGSTKQLLTMTGADLQQPCLWIGFLVTNPSHFALDSIGRYFDPPLNQGHEYLQLMAFWRHIGLSAPLEIVITGSSMAYMGVNPEKIDRFKSFNLGAVAGDLPWQKNTIINYVLNQCPQVKVICSSLDIEYLGFQNGDYYWSAALSQSKGFKYDSTHLFWRGGATADFLNIIKQIPLPQPWSEPSYSGFLSEQCNGWGNDPPTLYDIPGRDWTIADSNYQKNLATLVMIADTLRSRNIHWIVINFPLSPYYRNTNYSYAIGPLRETEILVLQQLRAIESSNRFFHLFDENKGGNHDYGNEDARDENHLCGTGADKLTPRLDMLIDSILK